MNDIFSNAILTNENTENLMDCRENAVRIELYSWHNFPGFIAIDKDFEGTKKSIIIHHMQNPDFEQYYSVTIGAWGGGIELTTSEFVIPLCSLLGFTIGALAKATSVIEFLTLFEDFTGYGFHKF